eukprot:7903624-Pyramimonas_sp.AAC.1
MMHEKVTVPFEQRNGSAQVGQQDVEGSLAPVELVEHLDERSNWTRVGGTCSLDMITKVAHVVTQLWHPQNLTA